MSALPAFPCPHPQEISGTPHPVPASASRQAWIMQWQSLGPNCYSRPVPKVRAAAQVLPQVTTRTSTPAHCEKKAKWGSGAKVGASPPFPSQKVLLSDGTDGEGGIRAPALSLLHPGNTPRLWAARDFSPSPLPSVRLAGVLNSREPGTTPVWLLMSDSEWQRYAMFCLRTNCSLPSDRASHRAAQAPRAGGLSD